ncbi:MAG: carboxypeptidase-like regulatory domain-containing protein [Gemmataceae bacterium]|nr:carboxypeptidase-like regulatory domain-containing protein [Gemmataceae bacterium]
MMRQLTSGMAVIGLLALVGCSGSAPVDAKGVLMWEDGKPVAGASLRLVPKQSGMPEVVGTTGKDGDFTLSTLSGKAGAPPGEYTVIVSQMAGGGEVVGATDKMTPEQMAKAMMAFEEKAKTGFKSEIPIIYSDPGKTPLTLKIDGPNPKIELKLKKS